MIKISMAKSDRIGQGDIYSNVAHYNNIDFEEDKINIREIIFPYAIVLTQDCDLEQYYCSLSKNGHEKNDKHLFSILVAPLYNIEFVFQGIHLKDIGIKMQEIPPKKTSGRNLCNNETPRYHYLEFGRDDPIVPSVIDFKHYFTVNIDYLQSKKKSDFVCQVAPLYRELISQRYAYYLSRIGLPEGNYVEKEIGENASV